VFQKLGMTHSAVGFEPALEKFYSQRYDKTGAILPRVALDTPGAGEIAASAHDLVRFGMFHLKNRLPDQAAILSEASIDAMGRATSQEGERGFGVAWEVFERSHGYRVLSHRGGMPGVATLLQLVPEEDLVLVVLANGHGEQGLYQSRVWTIADLIMKAALPKWAQPRSPPPQAAPTFKTSPELRGDWRGTLHTHERDIPIELKFLETGDIRLQLAGQLPSLLSEASFKDGWLHGVALGDVGTQDVNRHKGIYLDLTLKLRGDVLNGSAVATNDERRGVELAHWVELRRQ
jgi:hypothetical protein